jgi:effector-binding domain-containing protein
MTSADGRIAERRVPGALLAGIRFLGQFDELPERFTRLRAVAQDAVIGPAVVLYRGRDPGGSYHLEAAYPVDDEVEGGGVASHLVPAHHALCLQRHGPVDSPGAVFREVFDAAGREGVDLTTDPPYAVVFLEERSELEPVEADHEVEVRITVMMPEWAAQLAAGLERAAGADVRRRVLGGVLCPAAADGQAQWAAWAGEVLGRLDAVVPDPAVRRQAVKPCAHRFPDWRIEHMRTRYQELGSGDALLVEMRLDQSVQGQSWYESPVRVGDTIYVTKDPVDQDGWKAAGDDAARRAAYCHCRLVAHARQAGVTLSATHCFCGSGWYDQLWEGILGRPVAVEVLQSILKGDECCTFAIHLPTGTR